MPPYFYGMGMNVYSELSLFIVQHEVLVGAFVLAVCVWLGFEFRLSFSGVPQLNPSQATLLINRQECFIVDVRDFFSYEKGHISQAINLPLVDLPKGHGSLEAHKDRPILLICAHGNQAAQAAHLLKKQGFKHLQLLKGGMRAWMEEGLPVVKGLKKN